MIYTESNYDLSVKRWPSFYSVGLLLVPFNTWQVMTSIRTSPSGSTKPPYEKQNGITTALLSTGWSSLSRHTETFVTFHYCVPEKFRFYKKFFSGYLSHVLTDRLPNPHRWPQTIDSKGSNTLVTYLDWGLKKVTTLKSSKHFSLVLSKYKDCDERFKDSHGTKEPPVASDLNQTELHRSTTILSVWKCEEPRRHPWINLSLIRCTLTKSFGTEVKTSVVVSLRSLDHAGGSSVLE